MELRVPGAPCGDEPVRTRWERLPMQSRSGRCWKVELIGGGVRTGWSFYERIQSVSRASVQKHRGRFTIEFGSAKKQQVPGHEWLNSFSLK